jgi:hypothetical protein
MHRLGLVYGASDMRLTPQGEYVFTAALAAYLARHDLP